MHPTTNLVVLRGTLSSDPRHRALPSGDELLSYEITTETADGRLSVPVAWFSPKRPPAVRAGDEVVAVGLVRRRFFRAGGATISRTEVVADVVARADTRTADRALEGLRSALADDTTNPAAGSPSGGSPQSPRAR